MDYILEVENIRKSYRNFTLRDVNFSIPYGNIVGLIGENGAGKSTIIKIILDLIRENSGNIRIFGKNYSELEGMEKEDIGVVFDGSNFHDCLTPVQLCRIMHNIYSKWDEEVFYNYLSRFQVPTKDKIKDFSRGMKMKLSIAVALSHQPKLLILDEATSGLDPIIRDEILEVFLDFVQDEKHSILISSHITSDLEKIADYITFIHEGAIVFTHKKDDLIYKLGIIKCGSEMFNKIEKKDIIAFRKQNYQWEVLVADKEKAAEKYKKAVIDNATIDEIMLIYVKGEKY